MVDGEGRVLRVIERRTGPGRRVVTSLTSGREELRLCRVTWVRRVVVVGLMAAYACRRQRRVVAVDMAIRALPRRYRVGTGQRERRVVVVERRVGPHDRVMAQLALLREARRHVTGVRRAVVVLEVTGGARRAVQAVVIVDVAIRALPWWY